MIISSLLVGKLSLSTHFTLEITAGAFVLD